MTYSRISIKSRLTNSLTEKMLGTSLWGVLDITFNSRRYVIIDIVNQLIENNYFKGLGFSVRIIDGMNFIQKIPYFDGNEEFIKEHELYLFDDRPSYQAYLKYMHDDQKRNK